MRLLNARRALARGCLRAWLAGGLRRALREGGAQLVRERAQADGPPRARRVWCPPQGWPWGLGREAQVCDAALTMAQVFPEEGRYELWPSPCGRSRCPVCLPGHDRRRAARVQNRAGGAPGLGAWVLTLPRKGAGAWYQALTRQGLAWTRKAAALVVQLAHPGRIGTIAVVHPTTDSCRCTRGPEHLSLPRSEAEQGWPWRRVRDRRARDLRAFGRCPRCGRAARAGAHVEVLHPLLTLTERGRLAPLPRLLPREQLDAVRALWGEVLGALADVAGRPEGTPNLHYRYRATPAAVAHRLRYAVRVWAAWGGSPWRRALRLTYGGLLAPNARGAVEFRAAVADPVEDLNPAGGLWVRAEARGGDFWALGPWYGHAGALLEPACAADGPAPGPDPGPELSADNSIPLDSPSSGGYAAS